VLGNFSFVFLRFDRLSLKVFPEFRESLRANAGKIIQIKLALLATYFHAGFLLGLFFDPEDGGDMFLRNVG
jgi:hypothetical protein